MKQTFVIGSLLVVPLAAWLLWMTTDAGGAKESVQRRSPLVDAPAEAELPQRAGSNPPSPGESAAHASEKQDALDQESAVELTNDDLEEETDPVRESRRIRLPVIQAIRGNHPTPEARREAMLEALRRSGRSDAAWTKQSTAVFDDWIRGISTDVGLRPNWSTAQCYQAGCEVELSFPDRASYERAAKEFRSLREEGATHGGRVQTPPVEAEGGEILASWIMMRPDGSRS